MSIEVSRRSVLIGGSVVAGTALLGTPARASVPTSAGIPDLDVHVIVVEACGRTSCDRSSPRR